MSTSNLLRVALLSLVMCQPAVAEQLLIPVNKVPAPGFELPALDESEKTLADFAGKALVINFWGTWCPPCRAEMPALQRLWEQTHANGVEVIGIAVADDPADVKAFATEYGLKFSLILDKDGALAKRWKARTLPSTYVLDSEHRIRYRATGEREWDAPDVVERVLTLTSE